MKRLNFDLTDKWYTLKPDSFQESEMCKIPWDFQIQSDHPILTRRPGLVSITQNLSFSGFAISADHKVKVKESKKLCLDLARELKKLRNMKVMVIPIIIGSLGTVSKNLEKIIGEL